MSGIKTYYANYVSNSGFPRFGLWAPARNRDGSHRFVTENRPDSYVNRNVENGVADLGREIYRLQELFPGENIFVAGRMENDAAIMFKHKIERGVDWWPLGIVTPSDYCICFRYKSGGKNPDSYQPKKYVRARINRGTVSL